MSKDKKDQGREPVWMDTWPDERYPTQPIVTGDRMAYINRKIVIEEAKGQKKK